MRIMNDVILNAQSMGASINSPAIWCGHAYVGALQLVWTGTPVGDFTVQASNNNTQPTNPPTDPSNWTTLSSSTVAAGGAGGDFIYQLDVLGYLWVRVVFTRTSGSGALTLIANMKGA